MEQHDEKFFADLQNIVMEETNTKTITHILGKTERGNLELCLDKGEDKFYFSLNGEKCLPHTNEVFRSKGLIIKFFESQINGTR